MVGRRAILTLPLGLTAKAARAAGTVRVGSVRSGSLAWELDVIRAHKLERGFRVETVEFAATPATLAALQAGHVDTVLQDWLFVSRERAEGLDWTFAPASAGLGAVLAPPGSPVRAVADLAGKRLGVADTPLNKSWLLTRVFAQETLRLDLDAAVQKTFGPPPLLAEQLQAGVLDAVLTYWPFAALGEAHGLRVVLNVEDVPRALGFPAGLPMLGYVFSERWAAQNREALEAFLAAGRRARAILATSDPEWDRIAPLTGASSPGELERLRAWYRRGVPDGWDPAARRAAERLYDVLAAVGGPDLVGSAAHLARGTFWTPG